jgi:hypothetical protein
MKVSELKAGMLLRFKAPRYYKFLADGPRGHWFDCRKVNMTRTMRGDLKLGQPLIVYLGQEQLPAGQYGNFRKARKISVEGRVAWMWPENWKHVEAV